MAGYLQPVKLNNLVITSFTTLEMVFTNSPGTWVQEKCLVSKMASKAGVKNGVDVKPSSVLLHFFRRKHCIKAFMDEPTELAMHTGITYLKILSPFYFVVSAKLVADGILRGAGLMKNFMIATFTDLIRVVICLCIL